MKKFRYIKEYNPFGYDSNSDLFSDRFLSISDDFNLREMISNNGTWNDFTKDLHSGWWFAFPIKDNGLEFRLTIKKQYLTDDFKKALYGFLKKFEEISGLKMLTWGEHFSTRMANDKNLLFNSFIFSNPKNIYEPHFVNVPATASIVTIAFPNELRDIPKITESFDNIESICKKYNIENYTISEDGLVDVDGDVYLSSVGLTKLPLKFGKVTGDFNCNDNQLITLEGSPREVGGDFYCNNNQLITLEGSPREVTGDFYCNNNKLITLEGGPREVGGNFNCYDNQLITLEGSPREVGGDFNCNSNQLITLEGSPREVGGDFSCSYNPIYSVYRLFPDYKSFMDSLDYSYLRGVDIVRSRFQEALDEQGKKMPNKIEGYNWI